MSTPKQAIIPHLPLVGKIGPTVQAAVQDLLTATGSHAGMGELPVSERFSRAVGRVVRRLLCGAEAPERYGPPLDNLPHLTPGEVALVYEYLRTFAARPGPDGTVQLVPCPRSRRNQGLFYTPQPVVEHIVRHALQEIRPRRADLIDIRVLDPAMGCGVFLVEAMNQITAMVLASDNPAERERVDALRHGLRDRAYQWGRDPLDRATAVKIHLLEQGLHGVDLDPVAVEIARQALIVEALAGLHDAGGTGVRPGTAPPAWTHDLKPLVRVGDALMGDAGNGRGGDLRSYEQTRLAAYRADGGDDCVQDDLSGSQPRFFHWPERFPGIFGADRPGFDVIVGNPPYEVLSVKESGIQSRERSCAYVRRMYATCEGKANTYKLMIERSVSLLTRDGVLGFIVPSTLLADTTAARLRRLLLEQCSSLRLLVIPEKARVFPGVTQALAILIAARGQPADAISLSFSDQSGDVDHATPTLVPVQLITSPSRRIPLIKTPAERHLFQALQAFPALSGNGRAARVGPVHQGEINLTVHREHLRSTPTGFPLIRGEHIRPYRPAHPTPAKERLDWVDSGYCTQRQGTIRTQGALALDQTPPPRGSRARDPVPWLTPRLGIGRVVNMGTYRRLKAVLVPAGALMGDMTNYIPNPAIDPFYLLGLLNSRLLNWRFKMTSSNNYLSAAEIQSLPIPRPEHGERPEPGLFHELLALAEQPPGTLEHTAKAAKDVLSGAGHGPTDVPGMIAGLVETLVSEPPAVSDDGLDGIVQTVDGLVLLLYGVEQYAAVVDG